MSFLKNYVSIQMRFSDFYFKTLFFSFPEKPKLRAVPGCSWGGCHSWPCSSLLILVLWDGEELIRCPGTAEKSLISVPWLGSSVG